MVDTVELDVVGVGDGAVDTAGVVAGTDEVLGLVAAVVLEFEPTAVEVDVLFDI
jgi:hypothetical protein